MEIGVRTRVAFIEKHRSNPCSQSCAQRCTSVADEGCVDVKARARRYYEEEKARVCVCGNFQEKSRQTCYILLTQKSVV